MQEELFKSIEEDLSELLIVLSEEEYVDFVEKDSLVKAFEIISELKNRCNIFTNDALMKIAKYVNLKLDMYR